MLFIYSTWSLVSKNGASYRIWSTYEWVIAQRRKEGSNSMLWSTGCPKKKHSSCILVITTLWNELGRKVGYVSKNSENCLFDRHQKCSIWPTRRWENWVERWQPSLKNMEKMEKILMDGSDFLRHPVMFKFELDNKIHILNIMWNPC